MAKVISLTKTAIDRLPYAGKNGTPKQYLIRDKKDRHFGIRVGKDTKTFICWCGPKCQTKTIGHYGDLTVDEARKAARKKYEEPKQKGPLISLRDAITKTQNKLERKGRSPTTVARYKRGLARHLPDWMDRPITKIDYEMVLDRHDHISNNKERVAKDNKRRKNGPVVADDVMKLLRVVLNHNLPVDAPNPVDQAKRKDLFNNRKGRGSEIEPKDLPMVFEAIQGLPVVKLPDDEIAIDPWKAVGRDFLMLCLYTGLRSGEARCMKWDQVDFEARTITIPPEVAKNRQKHMVPMSRQVMRVMMDRLAWRDALAELYPDDLRREYVFPNKRAPGKNRKKLYMDSAAFFYRWVSAQSGVQFTTHALRHTFASQALRAGIMGEKVKYLLNHKPANITMHYQHLNEEDVREDVQVLCDVIDKACKNTELYLNEVKLQACKAAA